MLAPEGWEQGNMCLSFTAVSCAGEASAYPVHGNLEVAEEMSIAHFIWNIRILGVQLFPACANEF